MRTLRLQYDAACDFAPLLLIGDGANVLMVHPSAKLSDVVELKSAVIVGCAPRTILLRFKCSLDRRIRVRDAHPTTGVAWGGPAMFWMSRQSVVNKVYMDVL